MELKNARHFTPPFGQACEFRTGSSEYLRIPEELRGQAEVIPKGFPTRGEGFFPCRAIVPNGSTRRASVGVLRLFGFSPEGDTSLPMCIGHSRLLPQASN
jgi:hypothetical protein